MGGSEETVRQNEGYEDRNKFSDESKVIALLRLCSNAEFPNQSDLANSRYQSQEWE